MVSDFGAWARWCLDCETVTVCRDHDALVAATLDHKTRGCTRFGLVGGTKVDTAEHMARLLPQVLRGVYWDQKADEYFAEAPTPPVASSPVGGEQHAG